MIKKVFIHLVLCASGFLVGAYVADKKNWKEIYKAKKENEIHFWLQRVACFWVTKKQNGFSCSDYLEKKGIHYIGVYNNNDLTKVLLKDVENSSVQVLAIIDKGDHIGCHGVKSESSIEDMKNMDAIICTDKVNYEEKSKLEKQFHLPVITIDDMLFEAE